MADIRFVGDDIFCFDDHLFGLPNMGSVYAIKGQKGWALIETGTSHFVPVLLEGLEEIGAEREKILYIAVSHIHLDHAGGAGFLLDHLPHARVVAHRRGARHLISPSRLLDSLQQATIDASNYGGIKAIPAERMMAAGEGDVIDLGDRSFQVLDTPGHAPHHICLLERETGVLFSGELLGGYYEPANFYYPTSPYPDFSSTQLLDSMARVQAMLPRRVLFSHFGPGPDPQDCFRRAQEVLNTWQQMVQGGRERGQSLATIVQEAGDILSKNGFFPSWFDQWYADTGIVRGMVGDLEREKAGNLKNT